MITALDFGCDTIRSAFCTTTDHQQIVLFAERAEYSVLPNTPMYLQSLADGRISYAECEDSLVVFGNRAAQVRWLSRKPCAPIFTDGNVPTNDAPARQILSVLTQALLPQATQDDVCCFTTPGGRARPENSEFLSRIISMHGWTPVECSAADAVNLAGGNENRFTGISIVFGAESCEVCISRFGVTLASDTIDVGSNWIDSELAEQQKLHTWDDAGNCYLDLGAVRDWKHNSQIHLRNGFSEREKTLARLYDVVLNRIAKTVRDLRHSHSVMSGIGDQRLPVICAGGATQLDGFASALTERFVDHDVAARILSVRLVDDPETAVVRGLLIRGELEQRQVTSLNRAA